jgi:hypothetical protein
LIPAPVRRGWGAKLPYPGFAPVFQEIDMTNYTIEDYWFERIAGWIAAPWRWLNTILKKF